MVSCAMGGLLEEMEEGRFTGVCGEDMWPSVREWTMGGAFYWECRRDIIMDELFWRCVGHVEDAVH